MHSRPAYNKNPLLALIGLGLATSLISASAAAQDFVEGRDYIRILPSVSTEVKANKVEVREFFWYACPRCYSMETLVEKWKKPDAVQFVLTPALLGKKWVTHAFIYYTLEQLQRLDDLHGTVFEAIHEHKLRLDSETKAASFFSGHGIKKERFLEVFDSMAVDAKIKRAEKLASQYGIDRVPTFTVNGKYLTSPSLMQHRPIGDFFRLLDYLVSLESRSISTPGIN